MLTTCQNHLVKTVALRTTMISLDTKPINYGSLFFGDYGNIARLDIGGDPQFKKLAETDEANFWSLNLVSCSQDRWHEMPENALSKFQKNLAYQTVMDSTVPDVFSHLSEIATDPWLTYLYSRISTMEQIHAMSYSSGISQAFGAKAESFLDIIYTDDKIKSRVATELDVSTRFVEACKQGFVESDDNKRLLLETLTKIFLLEGVKFPFSFFTSWTINKACGNTAQGFSQLLIKIAIDEMQVHTTTGANVIRKLRKSADFKHLFDSGWFDAMFTQSTKDVVASEIDWATYLLEDGELLGFNQLICEHFIQYWADRRLKELNLPPIYNVVKNDIEDWFDDYRNVNSKHSALQEIDSVTYQKNTIVNDLYRFDEATHA